MTQCRRAVHEPLPRDTDWRRRWRLLDYDARFSVLRGKGIVIAAVVKAIQTTVGSDDSFSVPIADHKGLAAAPADFRKAVRDVRRDPLHGAGGHVTAPCE